VNNRPGTLTSTLLSFFNKGIRYGSVIDAGCADGHFSLYHHAPGLFPDAAVLNIDANAICKKSLKAVRDVIGHRGHIRSRRRSRDDRCRSSLLERVEAGRRFLLRSRQPPFEDKDQGADADTRWGRRVKKKIMPPYQLKLDVQGSEVNVLKNADSAAYLADVPATRKT
jgi:hypothetical protein